MFNREIIHIEDNSYASDYKSKIRPHWTEGVCLTANAGGGKTRLNFVDIKEGEFSNMVCFAPFTAMIKGKQAEASNYGVGAFAGKYEANATDLFDSHMCTPTSFMLFRNGNTYEMATWDETDTFISQAHFRPYVIEAFQYCQDNNIPIRHMTATYQYLELIGVQKIVKLQTKPKYNDKGEVLPFMSVDMYETKLHPMRIFRGVIDRPDIVKDTTALIHTRILSVAHALNFSDLVEARGEKCAVIYSTKNQYDISVEVLNQDKFTDIELENIKKGIIPDDVRHLITTSIFDCGIDVKIDKDRNYRPIAINTNNVNCKDIPDMISGDSLTQLINRARRPDKTYAECYGAHGTESLDIKWEADHILQTYDKMSDIIREANKVMNRNGFITKEHYIRFMSEYDIKLNYIDDLSFIPEGTAVKRVRGKAALGYLDRASIKVGSETIKLLDSDIDNRPFTHVAEDLGWTQGDFNYSEGELTASAMSEVSVLASQVYLLSVNDIPKTAYVSDSSVQKQSIKKLTHFVSTTSLQDIKVKYESGENIKQDWLDLDSKEDKDALRTWLIKAEGFDKNYFKEDSKGITKKM